MKQQQDKGVIPPGIDWLLYCQTYIETDRIVCTEQCDHCKEYYKPVQSHPPVVKDEDFYISEPPEIIKEYLRWHGLKLVRNPPTPIPAIRFPTEDQIAVASCLSMPDGGYMYDKGFRDGVEYIKSLNNTTEDI